MNCKCKDEINAKLATMNLRLVGYTYLMPDFRLVPQISTEWVSKDKAPKGEKNKPTAMLASHCPFCGVKIEQPT
jgi:hypothetical protein